MKYSTYYNPAKKKKQKKKKSINHTAIIPINYTTEVNSPVTTAQ
jgi:hypothetical protein